MSATAAVKRKFPPPCWTPDEALVLIQAYRQRWHALNRAFLKNPDWDAVAHHLTTSFPHVTPPKTSAQCRHKMEKLRQRHRAEKLRASSFPHGQFFSSWFYFDAMETMENGPTADPGSNNNQKVQEISNGIPNSDHQRLNPGRGIRFKPSHVHNLVTLAASPVNHSPDFDSRVSNQNLNNWSNQQDDDEDGYQEPAPRKFSKVVHDHEVDDNGEMWIKVNRNRNLFKGKNQNENDWNRSLNGGKKRRNDGIHEVVSSIKVLGDGFMKMEKMKIDMAREIERMRMETEMKRNQLFLESQKQIVDAMVKGLIETRKQSRTETMGDS